jgi:hypothetical protein
MAAQRLIFGLTFSTQGNADAARRGEQEVAMGRLFKWLIPLALITFGAAMSACAKSRKHG